jgi:hypothetical protein
MVEAVMQADDRAKALLGYQEHMEPSGLVLGHYHGRTQTKPDARGASANRPDMFYEIFCRLCSGENQRESRCSFAMRPFFAELRQPFELRFAEFRLGNHFQRTHRPTSAHGFADRLKQVRAVLRRSRRGGANRR